MPKIKVMPFQREIVTCAAPFICFMGGRGSGKSFTIQSRMKWRSSKYPRLRSMYVTPLSVQGLVIYQEMMADVEFRKFVKKSNTRPYPEIWLKNGSHIWFRSFQRPDAIRSTGEDDIYPDESQDPAYTENQFDTCLMPLLGRRPSPAGGRGVLFLSGQFRGDDWRKKRYWDRGIPTIDGKKNPLYKPDTYQSWRIPSSEGWSYKTPGGTERLELIKNNTRKAVWDQEWDCIPMANANAAFPSYEIDAITKQNYKLYALTEPLRHRGYCAGVDIGRIIDGTVIVVMAQNGDVVFVEVMPQGLDYGLAAKKCAQISAHFNACMIVDATGGATPAQPDPDKYVKLYREAARQYQIPFREHYWGRNKNSIVEGFALAIHQKRITIPAIGTEQLISEMKAYEYQYSEKTHCYTYNAPRGQHDDCVAAITQAWHGVESGFCPMHNGNLARVLG